tara:strand:- start:1035 stop:1688 length:654 start_codon:yes stop_codon:yes gene_type:complete
MNHYATLGIDPDADHETIRQAWVAAARVNHPDALAGASDEERHNAELKMRAINEAWRILGSTQLKVQYDEELSQAEENPDEIEDPWSDDWFDLEASDPPGFEVGNPVVATVLRALPWLVIGAIGVGIFVFSAFATNSRPERWQIPNSRTTHEECVVIREDGTVRTEDQGAHCGEPFARQVVAKFAMDADEQCPPGSEKTEHRITYYCLASAASADED